MEKVPKIDLRLVNWSKLAKLVTLSISRPPQALREIKLKEPTFKSVRASLPVMVCRAEKALRVMRAGISAKFKTPPIESKLGKPSKMVRPIRVRAVSCLPTETRLRKNEVATVVVIGERPKLRPPPIEVTAVKPFKAVMLRALKVTVPEMVVRELKPVRSLMGTLTTERSPSIEVRGERLITEISLLTSALPMIKEEVKAVQALAVIRFLNSVYSEA